LKSSSADFEVVAREAVENLAGARAGERRERGPQLFERFDGSVFARLNQMQKRGGAR
jgi:hypothetical protein